jgi:hypothetical protein
MNTLAYRALLLVVPAMAVSFAMTALSVVALVPSEAYALVQLAVGTFYVAVGVLLAIDPANATRRIRARARLGAWRGEAFTWRFCTSRPYWRANGVALSLTGCVLLAAAFALTG